MCTSVLCIFKISPIQYFPNPNVSDWTMGTILKYFNSNVSFMYTLLAVDFNQSNSLELFFI